MRPWRKTESGIFQGDLKLDGDVLSYWMKNNSSESF